MVLFIYRRVTDYYFPNKIVFISKVILVLHVHVASAVDSGGFISESKVVTNARI